MPTPVLPFLLQPVTYTFGAQAVTLLVPEAEAIKAWYDAQRRDTVAFPYWAKPWPAAFGLCRYLLANTALISGKAVLEVAAGLGLPSLFAATWAKKVCCTDVSAEAVAVAQQAAALNGLTNVEAFTLDWNDLPPNLKPDVLLVSDVNYDPQSFDPLYTALDNFLQKGTQIMLSTPQRLMAKPFIERLQPYCVQQQTVPASAENSHTDISIFVLQKTA